MSGRRRREDGWDEGRRDAHADDRRDSWGGNGAYDWASRDYQRGGASDRLDSSAGSVTQGGRASDEYRGAGGAQSSGYERAGYDSARYDAGSGYGGQRDAASGYGTAGYSGNGYAEQGYGAGRTAASDTYQGSGYSGNGYGAGGYEAAGSDATSYDVGYRDSSAGAYGDGYGGGAGYGAANGRAGTGYVPEFTPIGGDDADDAQPGTPRPIGRLSIYTLHDDKTAEFDRLAERAAEGVKASEPDTLVFVIHVVPKAPMQRIIYEIYRDRAAFDSHERRPHIQQFAADSAACVLATNIIDLRLKYAKVAALGATPADAVARPQASWAPRALESAAPAASFTPADDRQATVNGQYAANGREQHSQAAQYGNAGNGAYGADNGQYSGARGYVAANSDASGGYSAANGSNGYATANGYSSSNGYASANGYSGANGYQSASGYSGANGSGYGSSNASPSGAGGYANGSYSGAASGYPNGTAGYPNGSESYASDGSYGNGSASSASGGSYGNGTGSYANGAGYTATTQNGSGYGAAANGYGTAGYGTAGYGTAGYGEAAQGQYGAGRYRELPSAAQSGSAAYPDGASAYQDDRGRSSYGQASEWDPRASQDPR